MTQALASPETDERPRTNVAIQRAVRDGLPTPKQRNAKAHSNARQLKAKVQAFWERVCAASPHEPVHTNETVDRDRGVAALKRGVIATYTPFRTSLDALCHGQKCFPSAQRHTHDEMAGVRLMMDVLPSICWSGAVQWLERAREGAREFLALGLKRWPSCILRTSATGSGAVKQRCSYPISWTVYFLSY